MPAAGIVFTTQAPRLWMAATPVLKPFGGYAKNPCWNAR
jgi:hypothetical protein